MKKLFPTIVILSLIALYSCSTHNKTKKSIIQKSEIPDSLPSITFLDSLCQANSTILYDWTLESSKNEKSIPNKHDLDIKINRKVQLNFKDKKYTLFPFFRVDSSNSAILMLHFLLIDGDLGIEKLNTISFDNLARIESGKAYYYYGINRK